MVRPLPGYGAQLGRYLAAHGALVVRPLPGYGAHLSRYPAAHGVLVVRPLPGYGAHLSRYPAAHGALVVRTSQGMELTWAGTRQGWAHRNRAHRPHCRAPPAHLSLRADKEHLRAGLELTNSSSDRSVTLGFTLCGLPLPGLPRASTAAGAPGLCLHPPPLLSLTPGFLSLAEGLLEVVSHSWTR